MQLQLPVACILPTVRYRAGRSEPRLTPLGRQRQFVTFECRPFGRKIVAAVGRQARTTAVASSREVNGFGEGQVPSWTGHSL